MACSLSLAPLCQPRLLAGQEHGRTIPLGDIGRPLNELVPEQLSCATLVLLRPEPRGRQ